MAKGLWERLRGARRIEWFAALALAALLALALPRGVNAPYAPKTELEERMEDILSRMEGVGPVSVMITEDEDGGVKGVLIVARELEDLATYLRLQRAVAALLEVETDRIEIVGHSGSFGGTA